MRLKVEHLEAEVDTNPDIKRGVFLDTNILFAASFPLDTHNTWAEQVIGILHDYEVPLFTNINVRTEFLELNRRVLIPEGLIDMSDDLGASLMSDAEQKIKSLKTRKARAASEGRTFKLTEAEIKQFRDLLERYKDPSGANGWELFCADYFKPYIKNVWEDAVEALNVQIVGTREIDAGEHFPNKPTWEGVTRVMGISGIGSADAMIVNLFLESDFPLIVTTDSDVAKAVVSLVKNKLVIAP
jgi:predicted nucleic acid-binding protein